jgi:lipid-binding SYLF domain-containing protein
MNRTLFVIAVAMLTALGTLVPGCTTTGGSSGDPQARRESINSSADSALSRLYREAGGSRELVESARGVLIFPSFFSAGFIVGGAHGQGVLRKGGQPAGFFRMTEASVGLLAGAQSQAVFILFMTDDALSRFENSAGWTAGVDASVAMASLGADARVTTQTAQQPVIGFVLTNGGLMGSLSLNGNRITRLNLD